MVDKVPIFDIETEVTPELPQVPRPLLMIHARRAIRHFCRKALVCEREETINWAAGDTTAQLTIEDGFDFVETLLARWGDYPPLRLVTEDQLDLSEPEPYYGAFTIEQTHEYERDDWRSRTQSPPEALLTRAHGEVQPVLKPGEAGTLVVKYALMPARGGNQIDEIVMERWYEVIAEGTIASLLKVPKKPWSDINLGIARWAGFEQASKDVRAQRLKGYNRDDWTVSHVASAY